MTTTTNPTFKIDNVYFRLRYSASRKRHVERTEVIKRTPCFVTTTYGCFRVRKMVNPLTGNEVECFYEKREKGDLTGRLFFADNILCTPEGGEAEVEATKARLSERFGSKVY